MPSLFLSTALHQKHFRPASDHPTWTPRPKEAAPAPAPTREEPPAADADAAAPPKRTKTRPKSPLNDEVAAVLHDAGLRQYYEPFIENEIDVLARVEINQCVRLS